MVVKFGLLDETRLNHVLTSNIIKSSPTPLCHDPFSFINPKLFSITLPHQTWLYRLIPFLYIVHIALSYKHFSHHLHYPFLALIKSITFSDIMTAMEKRLIPSDFDDDRIFYLHVDPLAIIHELPSLFYRKYRPLLGERMIVMDLNNNQIELSLCKGNSSGYIVHGFENLVNFFVLSLGGGIKIMYVGEDVFIVMKVKDSFMATKELSYPYPKLVSNYYHLTHESTLRE
ncbi:hypothetical protein S245_066105, partial [Arachis hypogaea]